jgi:hypothetical protein
LALPELLLVLLAPLLLADVLLLELLLPHAATPMASAMQANGRTIFRVKTSTSLPPQGLWPTLRL